MTYLTQRFGAPRTPEMLSRLLHQRCSGNPLFLVEMVDDLARQGILQTQANTLHLAGGAAAVSSVVPESVQQLIAQHVGQLSLEEQTLLEAASVAGMTFSVAALAGWRRQGERSHRNPVNGLGSPGPLRAGSGRGELAGRRRVGAL